MVISQYGHMTRTLWSFQIMATGPYGHFRLWPRDPMVILKFLHVTILCKSVNTKLKCLQDRNWPIVLGKACVQFLTGTVHECLLNDIFIAPS